MLKKLLLSSRQLLVPRPLHRLSRKMETPVVESTTIYDLRRNDRYSGSAYVSHLSKQVRPSLLKSEDFLIDRNQIRWASSGYKSFNMPNPSLIYCNMVNMLKCVDLNDLKHAPPTAFWTGIALGSSQLVFPLLEMLIGYSSVLTMYQLYSSAMTVAFLGGVKLSLALCEKSTNWDTKRFSAFPPFIALFGLLMPYPVGFLVVGTSVLSALYLDLKSCLYPPWASSLLVFIYLTTAVGLLLALSAYVLFNKHKNKNENKTNNKKRVDVYRYEEGKEAKADDFRGNDKPKNENQI